jgi:hypothetical protein
MFFITKAAILAKIEANYGVDPTPTGASNGILVENMTIEPIARGMERTYNLPYFGRRPKVIVTEGWKVTFSTELKGSGTKNVPPEIGVLFRGCNFTEDINANDVTYDPNSDADSAGSITIYAYRHDILHTITGCRGSFKLNLKAGEYGKIDWEFQGLYLAPADASIVSPTFTTTIPPRLLSAAFTLDSYAAVIDSIKIDCKMNGVKRTSVNAATGILSYFNTQREVTGELDPEVVALSTKNWWAIWSAGTQVAFTATAGGTEGNRCVITGPKLQIDNLKYADRESILTHGMTLNFVPNTGNDEIKIMFN